MPDSYASEFSIHSQFFEVAEFVPPGNHLNLADWFPIHIGEENDFLWVVNKGGVILRVNDEDFFIWLHRIDRIGYFIILNMKHEFRVHDGVTVELVNLMDGLGVHLTDLNFHKCLLDDSRNACQHKCDFIGRASQLLVGPAQQITIDAPHLIGWDESQAYFVRDNNPILISCANFCDQFFYFLLKGLYEWLFINKVILHKLHQHVCDQQRHAVQNHHLRFDLPYLRGNTKRNLERFPIWRAFSAVFFDTSRHFIVQGLRGGKKGHGFAHLFCKALRVGRLSAARAAKDE